MGQIGVWSLHREEGDCLLYGWLHHRLGESEGRPAEKRHRQTDSCVLGGLPACWSVPFSACLPCFNFSLGMRALADRNRATKELFFFLCMHFSPSSDSFLASSSESVVISFYGSSRILYLFYCGCSIELLCVSNCGRETEARPSSSQLSKGVEKRWSP